MDFIPLTVDGLAERCSDAGYYGTSYVNAVGDFRGPPKPKALCSELVTLADRVRSTQLPGLFV